MAVVTVTTTVLGLSVDDAALHMVPYQNNVLRGVVLVAGTSQIIFMGVDGQARAVATLRNLADECEDLR